MDEGGGVAQRKTYAYEGVSPETKIYIYILELGKRRRWKREQKRVALIQHPRKRSITAIIPHTSSPQPPQIPLFHLFPLASTTLFPPAPLPLSRLENKSTYVHYVHILSVVQVTCI